MRPPSPPRKLADVADADVMAVLGALTLGQPVRQWDIKDCFPIVTRALNQGEAPKSVLDLGCGDGRAKELLEKGFHVGRYVGVDIDDSPEVLSAQRPEGTFVFFNGVDIPFDDDEFDIVYCRQVFEHVRHPDALLDEVGRVLRPGGAFFGSLSGLEPYHSRSIFNFTPYGLTRLLMEHEFELTFIGSGISGVALISRNLARRGAGALDKLVRKLPDLFQEISDAEMEDKNKTRLLLDIAGHIVFVAVNERTEDGASAAS